MDKYSDRDLPTAPVSRPRGMLTGMTAPFVPGGPSRAPAGRRRAARVRLDLGARVMLVTGHRHCRIDDLSQSGACLVLDGPAPPVSEGAVLEIDGTEAFGIVVWRRGNSFGLAFEEPLAMDRVVALRQLNDHQEAINRDRRRRMARDFVQGRRGVL